MSASKQPALYTHSSRNRTCYFFHRPPFIFFETYHGFVYFLLVREGFWSRCMNGAAILLSTFSLGLLLFRMISTTVEVAPVSGPCSRFRNWDIVAPSSLLCIRERRDRSPCTRIPYLATLLTSSAMFSIGALLYHIYCLLPPDGYIMTPRTGAHRSPTEHGSSGRSRGTRRPSADGRSCCRTCTDCPATLDPPPFRDYPHSPLAGRREC